jgi:ATP-dependent DNA helicase RecG
LRKEIELGRQVYVVFPLIEGSEKLDYKDWKKDMRFFKDVFPEFTVSMVHGRMKTADKEPK